MLWTILMGTNGLDTIAAKTPNFLRRKLTQIVSL